MLCSYSIEKLLGLKGVIVKKVEQTKNSTVIEIEMELKTHHCPDCGAATQTVHDYRYQTVKDIPAFGNQSFFFYANEDTDVPKCGKRFQEKNTFLPRYHRMTNRLAAYVLTKPGEVCSFTSVAQAQIP